MFPKSTNESFVTCQSIMHDNILISDTSKILLYLEHQA